MAKGDKMGWFWGRDEKYSDEFNSWYENDMVWMDGDGTWKKGTKSAKKGDESFTAGSSLSDKAKMWADSQYKREDAVLDTITETAKKAVSVGQNLALLALCAGGIYVYIKYFKKGAKK